MSKYTLRGVDVEFPYPVAYACQLAYMEKVIEALQEVIWQWQLRNKSNIKFQYPPSPEAFSSYVRPSQWHQVCIHNVKPMQRLQYFPCV